MIAQNENHLESLLLNNRNSSQNFSINNIENYSNQFYKKFSPDFLPNLHANEENVFKELQSKEKRSNPGNGSQLTSSYVDTIPKLEEDDLICQDEMMEIEDNNIEMNEESSKKKILASDILKTTILKQFIEILKGDQQYFTPLKIE